MRLIRYLCGAALVAVLALTALQLVEVRVGPLQASLLPQRAEEQFEGGMMEQDLGTVHLTFTPETAHVLLYDNGLLWSQYMIANDDNRLRFLQRFQAQWTADASEAPAIIRLELFVKNFETDTFDLWDATEYWVSGEGPNAWSDDFVLDFIPEDAGYYWFKLRISVDYDDEIVSSSEQFFELFALTEPDVVPNDAGWAYPQYGDLEAEGILLDWRGWHFGPCELLREGDASADALDAACEAEDDGDADALMAHLETALAESDDLWLQAAIYDQLGMIAAAQGAWAQALDHFEAACKLWLDVDDAFYLSANLHNVAIAYWQLGEVDNLVAPLTGAQTLREQLGDEIGAALTWAQTSILYEDWENLYGLSDWMRDLGLPQAEALQELAEREP